MLGKLLRQEFRATYRPFLLLYGATLLLTLLEFIGFQINQPVMGLIAMLALMLLSLVMLVLTVVQIARRYSNNLYRGEGYLMFSLPVPAWQLLVAKLIPAVLWICLSMLLFFVGQFSVVFAVGGVFEGGVVAEINRVFLEAGLPSLRVYASLLPVMAVMYFIEMVFFVLLIYFSITLANTGRFQGHSTLFGALIFLGLYLIYCVAEWAAMFLIPLGLQIGEDGWSFVLQGSKMVLENGAYQMGLGYFPLALAVLVLLFWLTASRINRHLSLK